MTEQPLYVYLPDHNAIICWVCEVAVPGRLAQRHLQGTHRLRVARDRRLQLLALPRGVQPRQDHTNFPPLPPGSERIPQLPTHRVWCCGACGTYLSSSARLVPEHHHQHHPTVRREDPWQVDAQRWFANSRYCQY
jgi:hypothetical protein